MPRGGCQRRARGAAATEEARHARLLYVRLTDSALPDLRQELDLVPRRLFVVLRALLHFQSAVLSRLPVSHEPYRAEVAPSQLPQHLIPSVLEPIADLRGCARRRRRRGASILRDKLERGLARASES